MPSRDLQKLPEEFRFKHVKSCRQGLKVEEDPSFWNTGSNGVLNNSPFYEQPKKDVLFIIGDWNAKIGSQEIPGEMGKFGFGVQNEAGQRLTEFCQENALVIANTLSQQHKRRLYTWTSPDGQH